jgi:hypothetical protein
LVKEKGENGDLMIQVIDDFIPKRYQDEIEKLLFGAQFPWYSLKDVTFGNHNNPRPGMFHRYVRDNDVVSDFYKFLLPLFYTSEIDGYVNQARSFLQFPLNKDLIGSDADGLHVDCKYPHKVLLYYVNDADADTIIVDHKHDYNDTFFMRNDLKWEQFDVLERVTPKKGRAVIFDGAYYHCAEQPTAGLRAIINFDIIETMEK